jgi:hypothetical protein
MLPNHHLTKPVLIGEIQEDGQFDIVSQTEPVPGDAWTDFLPESAVLNRIGRNSPAECTTPRPRPACSSIQTIDLPAPPSDRCSRS